MTSKYPDISDLLEAKARRRRELAALTWEEKVAIVRQMQLLLPKGVWRAKSEASIGWRPPTKVEPGASV